MRRPLGAIVCIGSLAALSTPVAAADAAAAPRDTCRVRVSAPAVNAAGRIQVTGARMGCDDRALLRIRVKQARRGPDRTLKSGAKVGVNGRFTLKFKCGPAPRTYYAVIVDYRGNADRSRAVRLSCAPPGTPTPTPTPTPTGSAAPTTPPGTVGTAEESEVVRLTNQERTKAGCKPLKHDPQLNKAAHDHSATQASRNEMTHQFKDGPGFVQRIRDAGFQGGSTFAENISYGRRTPTETVTGWMGSKGHRANILNCEFTLIGAGMAKSGNGTPYWTQVFVG
ncbi:CAP domain-containing protein [Planobispora takensis]|uniref:SCP domain-containing protein n=1 Tax=Planobispora takensis TaxID=1367882 RepID=A0A8J3WTQ8_9ACTN|nr:CAP domain-containing protein [Planobispora takensis]GII00638.1 hypothetical protein Pta02_26460 [Planobispora takensis]